MSTAVRKFKCPEAALIALRQYPYSHLLIGEGFYAIGRISFGGWSVLREDGFMVVMEKTENEEQAQDLVDNKDLDQWARDNGDWGDA